MLAITPAPRAKIDDYTNGGGMIEHRFNPYKDNGGSIVSRNQTKLFPLGDKMVLGATGCWADVLTLTKLVEARIQV